MNSLIRIFLADSERVRQIEIRDELRKIPSDFEISCDNVGDAVCIAVAVGAEWAVHRQLMSQALTIYKTSLHRLHLEGADIYFDILIERSDQKPGRILNFSMDSDTTALMASSSTGFVFRWFPVELPSQ